MTVTCPRGHQSASDDYCDECGARIGAPSAATPVSASLPSASPVPSSPTNPPRPTASAPEPGEPCPRCAAPRIGGDRFCEACGHDFVATTWRVTVTADREYYDRLAPPGVEFPSSHEPRSFVLTADETLIGRRSRSQGIEPDIDLSVSPDDPGVSHRHAALRRAGSDSWTLVDLGSTNGTAVNGSVDLIEVRTPVPVADGDRIHVGAWTTIVIERVAPAEAAP